MQTKIVPLGTLTPLSIEEDTEERRVERMKQQEDELIYHEHILNALSDRLYSLYTSTQSAREIWNSLAFKYKADEESTKKFMISKYFDFKMSMRKQFLYKYMSCK